MLMAQGTRIMNVVSQQQLIGRQFVMLPEQFAIEHQVKVVLLIYVFGTFRCEVPGPV